MLKKDGKYYITNEYQREKIRQWVVSIQDEDIVLISHRVMDLIRHSQESLQELSDSITEIASKVSFIDAPKPKKKKYKKSSNNHYN